jgi:hypothetical protein
LLSRPTLDPEAAEIWQAFQLLARDRQQLPLSMGLAGGLQLPLPVPLATIRAEGRRLGHTGESLDDFVETIALIDDHMVAETTKKLAADARAAANRTRSGR